MEGWARWLQSITGFNIKEDNIDNILIGFPGGCDGAIVINYCILYAKQHIDLEKIERQNFNVDFLGYAVSAQIPIIYGKRAYAFKKSKSQV